MLLVFRIMLGFVISPFQILEGYVKGGVKLYHLVCSCSAKRSELTGQHKCPHHLLREMACLRVGQQRTGRKVLMLPILRETCLEFGRQLPLCYA